MLSRLEAAVLAKSLAAFGATVQPWPYQLAREEYDHSLHGEAFPVGEMIVDAGLNGTGTGTVGGAGASAALASAEAAEAARRAAAAAVTAAAEASAEHALQKCLGERHNGRNAQQSEAQQAAAELHGNFSIEPSFPAQQIVVVMLPQCWSGRAFTFSARRAQERSSGTISGMFFADCV